MPAAPQVIPVSRARLIVRLIRRAAIAFIAGVLLLGVLFVVNGLWLASGETPRIGNTSYTASRPFPQAGPFEVKILAWNIAKGFMHLGGLSFEDRAVVEERVVRMIEVIRAEQPDLVFLSETVVECGPCPVNQVAMIAEAAGMHCWAFGENYNIGLPLYRMAGATRSSRAGRSKPWRTRRSPAGSRSM